MLSMHSTEHKRDCCGIRPWQRKNADRVCEHGDSRMLRAIKKQAATKRRQADKREARA